jgi:small conductance mechanosensitive channel
MRDRLTTGSSQPLTGTLAVCAVAFLAVAGLLHGVGPIPAAAAVPVVQEEADTLSPARRFEAGLDTVAQVDSAIARIDSWVVGRAGADGRLLDERRAARTDRRREVLWRLAEIAAELPAGEEPDPRVTMLDSLLLADARALGANMEEWVGEASMLAADALTLEGAERARVETRVHDLDTRIDDGLVALFTSLEARDSLGTDVSDNYRRLDQILGIRAELLAGRMARAEADIADLQDRIDQGVPGLEEEIAALDLDVTHTSDNLESALELMEDRGMETAEYRRYLLVSTGALTADNLNVGVLQGLLGDWVGQTRAWLDESGWNFVLQLLVFLAILAISWVIARVVNQVVVRALRGSHLNMSTLLRDTIVRWSTRIVMLLGLLIALSQIGVELGPVLAGLGVAGFVIGFALQDTLSNFAAGMMILLYRPFDMGDFVEVGGVVGKVADMSLVSTTVLSVDNQRYIIPNSQIWGNVIQNVTAERIRRVDLVFGIGYESDIPEAERILEDIVSRHERVLDDPEPMVKLSELGDSSVNFVVRPWCSTADYWDVRFDITRQVKLRFDEAGISIPFPQRDVHIHHPGRDDAEPTDTAPASVATPAGASGTGPVGGILRGEAGLDEVDQTPD